MRSKGELEAEVSQAVIRFEKEYMGRGPLETRAYVVEDMILVRLRNVLTPAEIKLVEAEDPTRGRDLIKAIRRQLFEQGRPPGPDAQRVLIVGNRNSLLSGQGRNPSARLLMQFSPGAGFGRNLLRACFPFHRLP